ncbi:MAG: hypothetical protein AVDCRST_MAG64-4050 [uncultured Phycisphaerae bacterium]|uniref:Uncharacterized protein n=1 Tax=uncultured Phycisphaerae bacterium TaxID=904963 RepID=A0A6J4QKA6_9BACT|nr:MAG: hypothetical protein AVDCRST_MAG64-4050 [uncultured Phycisphaerae bacterium]
MPRYPEMSDPQMPTRRTRTTASPGPGAAGSSISTFSNSPGLRRRMAFMVGATSDSRWDGQCPPRRTGRTDNRVRLTKSNDCPPLLQSSP